jgi:hypothetical protein
MVGRNVAKKRSSYAMWLQNFVLLHPTMMRSHLRLAMLMLPSPKKISDVLLKSVGTYTVCFVKFLFLPVISSNLGFVLDDR